MADYDNGRLCIDEYDVSLKGVKELLDIVNSMVETEIVDVDIDMKDVICTFANGEVHRAHCHSEDYENWSLETGISVCLGKYLIGGSNEYNRVVRQGVKIFEKKVKEACKRIENRIEEERIRENKRRKHERYLKRRNERRKAEAEAHHKQDKDKSTEDTIIDILNKIASDMGLKVEIEVVKV